MASAENHRTPRLPGGAFGLAERWSSGVFLGWTFVTRNWITRKFQYHAVWPDRETTIRSLSLLDAVNFLRGPHGIPALIEEA